MPPEGPSCGPGPTVAGRVYHRTPMLEQRIQQHFIDSADLKYQAAQILSKPISAAVQAILASVTNGGKVLACGNGGSAGDAQHFAAVHHLKLELTKFDLEKTLTNVRQKER